MPNKPNTDYTPTGLIANNVGNNICGYFKGNIGASKSNIDDMRKLGTILDSFRSYIILVS